MCFKCGNGFLNFDSLMMHKKTDHGENYTCKKYLEGLCKRGELECWYSHIIPNIPSVSALNVNQNQISKSSSSYIENKKSDNTGSQVFQKSTQHPKPPDALDKVFPLMKDLYSKIHTIEKYFQELVN